MKKILSLAAIALFLVSCSAGPNKNAEKFLNNMAVGKVEEAKKYCTESTGKMLDFATSMGSSTMNPDFKYMHVKDSIVNKKAWVTFKDKENDKENTLEMVNVDGEWKAHMKK